MGPNGVGKTSLLRSISKISPPTKGTSTQLLYPLCSYQLMVAAGMSFQSRRYLPICQTKDGHNIEKTDQFRIADIKDKSLGQYLMGRKKG